MHELVRSKEPQKKSNAVQIQVREHAPDPKAKDGFSGNKTIFCAGKRRNVRILEETADAGSKATLLLNGGHDPDAFRKEVSPEREMTLFLCFIFLSRCQRQFERKNVAHCDAVRLEVDHLHSLRKPWMAASKCG